MARTLPMVWTFAEVQIDEERREVHRAGSPVSVEPKVFDLIVHLIRNRSRVVPKDELLDTLWPDRSVLENALSVCIHRARVALGNPRWIRNFARRGYRFIGEPEESEVRFATAAVGDDVAESPTFERMDGVGPASALLAAEQAAFAAFSKLAFADAAAWFERGAELAERFFPTERARRARLLIGLGEALVRAGDEPGAARAFRLAESASKAIRERSAPSSDDAVLHPPEADRFLALMRAGVEIPVDVANVDADRELTDRVEAVERAAEEARRNGDLSALASALISRRWLASAFDMPSTRLQLSTEAVLLAQSLDRSHLLQEARLLHIHDLLENAQVAAAHAEMEVYADTAARLDSPLYQWVAAYLAAARAHMAGNLAEAEALALAAMGKAAALAPELAGAMFTTQIMAVKAYEGRMGEMVLTLEMFVDRYPQQPIGHANLASVYCELGRLDEGRREFDRATESESGVFRRMVLPHTIAALARPSWTLQEQGRAAALYEALLPWSGTNLVAPPAVALIGPVDGFLALLAQAAGRWMAAVRHYEDAIEACAESGSQAVQAQIQYQYAEGLLSRGRDHAAIELLDKAEGTARELNLSGLAAWIERLRGANKPNERR